MTNRQHAEIPVEMSVISEHPICTGFHRLTGYQRDPQDRGVTYSNDYFLLQNRVSFVGSEFSGSHCRLCMPYYTFTGFHRLTHMYKKKYQVFHLKEYLSLLAITQHIFSCSENSGTPLNFV